MKNNKTTIRAIGFIELALGLYVLFSLITYSLLLMPKKPLSVFVFLLLSSVISIAIGLGLLNYREWARVLLVFFSGYIIIVRVLILAGLLRFEGEVMAFIPENLKISVSIVYHCFAMLFFTQQNTKGQFIKKGTGT